MTAAVLRDTIKMTNSTMKYTCTVLSAEGLKSEIVTAVYLTMLSAHTSQIINSVDGTDK
jgi:hypothetical protein